MVPKHIVYNINIKMSFRAVLFRMVPKLGLSDVINLICFRAVLFRMVPKRYKY